jgi:hypothetical protein
MQAKNEATTQYFGKRFFIKRVLEFAALLNFHARHRGVKITGPYYTVGLSYLPTVPTLNFIELRHHVFLSPQKYFL